MTKLSNLLPAVVCVVATASVVVMLCAVPPTAKAMDWNWNDPCNYITDPIVYEYLCSQDSSSGGGGGGGVCQECWPVSTEAGSDSQCVCLDVTEPGQGHTGCTASTHKDPICEDCQVSGQKCP